MMEALGVYSEEKPEPASDIDTSIERQRSGNEKPQFLAKNGEASKAPRGNYRAHQVVSHHSPRRSGRPFNHLGKQVLHFRGHARDDNEDKNKEKRVLVTVPKTAEPVEVQALHNLKQPGSAVEAR
jgi:hypothetical protein